MDEVSNLCMGTNQKRLMTHHRKYTVKKKVDQKEFDKHLKMCDERIKAVQDKAKVDNESLRRQFDY